MLYLRFDLNLCIKISFINCILLIHMSSIPKAGFPLYPDTDNSRDNPVYIIRLTLCLLIYFQKIDKAISNIKNRGYDYTSQYARLAMQNFSRSLMEAVFKVNIDYRSGLWVKIISKFRRLLITNNNVILHRDKL